MASMYSSSRFRCSAMKSLKDAWVNRRVWWFTATARTQARFVRTSLGSFWLGLSNLFSIAVLAAVYGTVFKVENFTVYVVYLGLGLVVWNSLSGAIGGAPNLFEQSRTHLHNINLHPIFYTLEEWSFQLQTFSQSFILVLIALSFFQHNLLLNLFFFGWLPLLNFFLFLYWLPVLVCLLGARFRDLYQLVPIVLQLVFLLSPILYQKKNLGAMAWTANINPLYRILSPIRHTLMSGQVQWDVGLFLLILNICGVWLAIFLLNQERRNLPFLV